MLRAPHHRPSPLPPGCPAPGGRRRGEGGFSLVEALVGLTLLALVLIFSLAVLFRMPRQMERIEARQEANRAAEAVLEAVRAGAVPLAAGYRAFPTPGASAEAAEQLGAWLEVTPTDTPGLDRVAVLVRYKVEGEPHTVTVETQVWRR